MSIAAVTGEKFSTGGGVEEKVDGSKTGTSIAVGSALQTPTANGQSSGGFDIMSSCTDCNGKIWESNRPADGMLIGLTSSKGWTGRESSLYHSAGPEDNGQIWLYECVALARMVVVLSNDGRLVNGWCCPISCTVDRSAIVFAVLPVQIWR